MNDSGLVEDALNNMGSEVLNFEELKEPKRELSIEQLLRVFVESQGEIGTLSNEDLQTRKEHLESQKGYIANFPSEDVARKIS